MFAPKFCTFWYPYRLVGTLKCQIWRDRHLRLLRQPPGIAISVCSGSPPRDRHLWPSQSSVRGFGYDYDYGYGYVKSVDSIDNVNSVRSADNVNSMDNVNSANSAPFIPAAPPRRRITALLSTLSMLLTIGPALRTLLTLSMLSTLLT